jgi:DNA-binding beta-propeller fold protein YncE
LVEPGTLAVNPASNSLYVTSATSRSVSHFGAAPAGQLNFAGCVSDDGSGGACADVPGARLDLPSAIAFSSDGDSVYVADFFTSSVLHFAASPTGQLTFVDCVSDDGSGGFCTDVPAPFLQPSSLAVSPDDGSVYVADPTGGTFTHFRANATGRLDFAGCMSQDGSAGACTDVPGNAFGDPRRVAISPDGDSVYVTAGLASSVSHFTREVPPPPATADTDPPGLTLTTKEKSQAGKPIKVTLACDEPCTVELTGTAKPKGGKRKALGAKNADLGTGTAETLTLKPKGKLKRKLKRADRGNANVEATARDAAGNAADATDRVKLR